MQTRPKTLILGIGNILLRDEGIGIRIVEYMRNLIVSDDIELVDGGTAGADLIDVLSDRDLVIIIDAVEYGASPGTMVEFSFEDIAQQRDCRLSLHDLDIPATLAMTKILGCAPKRIIFYGIVPHKVEPGLTLTDRLSALVEPAAKKILMQLQ